MLRLQNQQPSLWEAILPPEVFWLSEELTTIDRLLDDERFLAPFVERFNTRIGRPTVPVATYLRLIYLKRRYQLGYETVAKEVADSFSRRRFCHLAIDDPVPEATTLIKLTHKHREALLRDLNDALLRKLKEGKVIKGRKLSEDELSLKDFQFAEGKIAACPAGQLPTREIHNEEKERWVVRFSLKQCGSCPMTGQCPVAERQKFYSLSFTDRQVVVSRRRQALDQEDYREKCRLRPAVEGTVSQFKRRTHNGKLTVRGYRRVRNAIIVMAIGINFGRIWAYLEQKKRDMTHSLTSITALFVALAVISTGEWLRKRLMAQTMGQEAIY